MTSAIECLEYLHGIDLPSVKLTWKFRYPATNHPSLLGRFFFVGFEGGYFFISLDTILHSRMLDFCLTIRIFLHPLHPPKSWPETATKTNE